MADIFTGALISVVNVAAEPEINKRKKAQRQGKVMRCQKDVDQGL